MNDAKQSDEARGKPARTWEMPAKPGGGGSNPGGKHLSGKGDACCGQPGAHGKGGG
jgi:hypothetical protein